MTCPDCNEDMVLDPIGGYWCDCGKVAPPQYSLKAPYSPNGETAQKSETAFCGKWIHAEGLNEPYKCGEFGAMCPECDPEETIK